MMLPEEWTSEQWTDVLSRIEHRSRSLLGSDCVEWVTDIRANIPPQLGLWDQRRHNVRRLLLTFAGRQPSPDSHIHTSCGNTRCVNVMHLFDTKDVPVMRIRKWNEIMQQSTVDEKTGCRLWTARLSPDGYGMTRFMNQDVPVHRFAYRVKICPIPAGLMVRHDSGGLQKCTSRACFEYTHLSLGTALDNTTDTVMIGGISAGAAHPKATITEEKALAIKHSNASINERASQFGVSRSVAAGIATGIAWSHLPDKDGWVNRSAAQRVNERRRTQRKRLREKGVATRSDYEAAWSRIEQRTTIATRVATLSLPCKLLPPHPNHSYPLAMISGVDRPAHITVAEFHHNNCQPIVKPLVVRHGCPGKSCVEPTHLSIGTLRQNQLDSLIAGPSKRTKLTVENVQFIKKELALGTSVENIVKTVPVASMRMVKTIKYGQAWAWVPVSGAVIA